MEKIRRYRGIIAATTTTLVATVVIVLVGCARSQIPLRPVSTIPNPSGQVTELPMIAETEVAAMPMTTPGAPDEAAEPSHSLRLLTPPMVIYQSPFRLFRFITELPSISVTFSKIVTGLMASDLTVNGSPATSITGSGEGPYVFTGFESPALGPITVTVAPGDIQGVGGEAFEGTSWTHTLIDPALDSDGDGVNDGEEVNTHFTDPTNPDTDGDPI